MSEAIMLSKNALSTLLDEATEGLIYLSESDYPMESFFMEDKKEVPFDSQHIREALKINPAFGVEESTFEAFFGRMTTLLPEYGLTEKNRARQFLHLQQILNDNLKDIKVFRFGRIQILAIVIGITAGGHWAGVKTTLIET